MRKEFLAILQRKPGNDCCVDKRLPVLVAAIYGIRSLHRPGWGSAIGFERRYQYFTSPTSNDRIYMIHFRWD